MTDKAADYALKGFMAENPKASAMDIFEFVRNEVLGFSDEKLMTIKQQIKGEEPMCDKNAREKYQKDASVECEAKCPDENENRSPLMKIDETILQFTFLYNAIWEIKNHLNDIEDSMAKIKSALLDAMQKNMKDQMPPITWPAPSTPFPPSEITCTSDTKTGK